MTDVDQSATTPGPATPGPATRPPAQAKPVDRMALAGLFGGLFTGYVGLTAAIPVTTGDSVTATFGGLGSVTARFGGEAAA